MCGRFKSVEVNAQKNSGRELVQDIRHHEKKNNNKT